MGANFSLGAHFFIISAPQVLRILVNYRAGLGAMVNYLNSPTTSVSFGIVDSGQIVDKWQ